MQASLTKCKESVNIKLHVHMVGNRAAKNKFEYGFDEKGIR